MATKSKSIPKAAASDQTISDVLDAVIDKNDVCVVLVSYNIDKKSVTLTFDNAKCTEAKEE